MPLPIEFTRRGIDCGIIANVTSLVALQLEQANTCTCTGRNCAAVVKLYSSPTCSGDAVLVKMQHDEHCKVANSIGKPYKLGGKILTRLNECGQYDPLQLSYDALPTPPEEQEFDKRPYLLLELYRDRSNCDQQQGKELRCTKQTHDVMSPRRGLALSPRLVSACYF